MQVQHEQNTGRYAKPWAEEDQEALHASGRPESFSEGREAGGRVGIPAAAAERWRGAAPRSGRATLPQSSRGPAGHSPVPAPPLGLLQAKRRVCGVRNASPGREVGHMGEPPWR